QAPETIGILKEVERPAVGPVIPAGQLTAGAGEQKDDGKQPDISPFYFFWQYFYLRNTPGAEIGHESPAYEQDREDPGPFEQEEGGHGTDYQYRPGDGIMDRYFERPLRCKGQKADGHRADEPEYPGRAQGKEREQRH